MELYMAALHMGPSFDFTAETIDHEILIISPGNYALGYTNVAGGFVVKYVGRSDTDLKKQIKKHLGEYEKYRKFKFSYASSSRVAFEKECMNYHDFGGDKRKLKKPKHPEPPDNTDWVCPVCNKLD
jgi:hypothetical protein